MRIVSLSGARPPGVRSTTASAAVESSGRTSYVDLSAAATAATSALGSCRTSLRILSRIQGMTPFADFATLGRRLERARGRLEKRDEVARFLRALAPAEIPTAVAFLPGRAFPAPD